MNFTERAERHRREPLCLRRLAPRAHPAEAVKGLGGAQCWDWEHSETRNGAAAGLATRDAQGWPRIRKLAQQFD
jgi:hypothetical protein